MVSPAGHRGLVVSSVPLHSSVGGQGDKPVDLTVEDRGSLFAPANPAVATTVPKQTSGELSLGELRIRPGADRLSSGRVIDGRVLYPNSARDTDLAVAPLPTGIETFTLLRSPAAPRSLGLGLGLGAGERLVASDAPGGGYDVVRDDQQRAAHIPQPTAVDAEGRPVAVRTTISASGLGLTVDATAKDTAWPVSVDPAVYYDFNNRREAGGWGNYAAGGSWGFWGTQNGVGGWGWGLYTYAGGSFPSAPAALGEWNYYGEFWRSSTAYVYAAEMRSYFSAGYGACRYAGIYNGTWEAGNDVYSNTCSTVYAKADAWCISPCDPTATAARGPNYAVFGTQAMVPNANSFINYLQAANVYIGDHEPPTATASGLPPGWVQDTGYQVTGSDTGVGVNNVSATGAQSWSSGCSVDPDNHCPANQTIAATTTNLPEGINNINANITDVIGGPGHTFNATIGQAKIDRTPPSLALGGTLTNGAVVTQDSTLTVNATDGNNDGNPADARSGVASIDMAVDGTNVEHVTQSACAGPGCPSTFAPYGCTGDSCSLPASYTASLAGLSEGPHTLTIDATDVAGNATAPNHTKTVQFFVDTTPPDLAVSGDLWDRNGETLSGGPYELDVAAADGGGAADPSSGVANIDIQVDGISQSPQSPQACPQYACPLSRVWTFDPSRFAPGDHTITVVATDQAGIQTSDDQTVTVARLASLPPQPPIDLSQPPASNAPGFQIDGAAAGDHAGASVVDIGDINGDGLDDYAVAAPSASPTPSGSTLPRVNAGSVYIVYGKTDSNAVDLSQLTPAQGFRIDGANAGDFAGTAIAAVPDANGDGIPDIAIGAPATSGTGPALTQGHAYVIFGSPCSSPTAPDPGCSSSSSNANVDLGNLGTRGYAINGPSLPSVPCLLATPQPKHFGAVLSTAPTGTFAPNTDVNGDGLGDLAIGSPDEGNSGLICSGSAYVVFGKADSSPVNVSNLGTSGFRIDGANGGLAGGDEAGQSVAIVGDTHGGGDFSDVLIGAPGANYSGRQSAGTVYDVFGKADSAPVALGALGPGGYPIYGKTGDNLGSSVAAMGDINGKGTADYALGGASPYVLYGLADATRAVDLAAPGSYNGYKVNPPSNGPAGLATVASTPDLNGADQPDLLFSYPGGSVNGHTTNGATYALLGQAGQDQPQGTLDLSSGIPGQLGSLIAGGANADSAGSSLAGIESGSDYDSGYVIGAPNAGNRARSQSGSAYVESGATLSGSSAAAARASDPGSDRTRTNCYPHSLPAYTFSPPVPHKTLPRSRSTGRNRCRDRREHSQAGSFDTNARLPGEGDLKAINSQPFLTEGVTYPIYDSASRLIANVQQVYDSNHKPVRHSFKFTDAAGALINQTFQGSRFTLQLTGKGCATTPDQENSMTLIAFPDKNDPGATRNGGGETGNSVDIRGFMRDSDLAAVSNHLWTSARTNAQEKNRYYAPCKRGFYGNLDQTATAPAIVAQRPQFQPREKYSSNTGSIPYANFDKPLYCDRTKGACMPGLTVLTASTSGVGGGGPPRGVLIDGAATRQGDQIRYVDRNVPCNQQALAQWKLVNANPAQNNPSARSHPLWAWLPLRNPDSFTRTCP